jgi:gluconate kinase
MTTGYLAMGVSGCGKSTIGKMLAEKLGWEFFDADDFHPAENIASVEEVFGSLPLSQRINPNDKN